MFSGLKRALAFGSKLPTFASQEKAQEAFFAERDQALAAFQALVTRYDLFALDFTPESLKAMETSYFTLHEANSFRAHGTDRAAFEKGMAVYFDEVAVRHAGAQWVVKEFAFTKGRFEIGIHKDNLWLMGWSFRNHHEAPRNKRRDGIYREYKQHFG